MSVYNIGPGYSTVTLPYVSSLIFSNIPSYYTICSSSYNDDSSELDKDVIEFLKMKQKKSKEVIKGLHDEIEKLKKQKDAIEKEFSDYKNNLDKKISEKVKEEIEKSIHTSEPSKLNNDLPTIEDVVE
jgi:hypothetical protein